MMPAAPRADAHPAARGTTRPPKRTLEQLWWRIAVEASWIVGRLTRPKRIARRCTICGYEGYFAMAGKGTRPDAKCPRCNSAERHRLFKLWFDRNHARLEGADVLHFAPERGVAALIRPLARSYCSADIMPGRADRVLNLEALALADASVDCIVCFHVLEHVNDRKALREFHRVLRPGGAAVIMIPVVEGWAETYEDATITQSELRFLHFGQADHVRIYGADVRARICAAGFDLSEFTAQGSDVLRYGLMPGEKVFIASRPSDGPVATHKHG
jgi:SAM-dependent methyltransferase